RTRSEIPDLRQAEPRPAPTDSTAAPGNAMAAGAPALSPDIFAAAKRIQEVAWTLRGRGADLSTCDQIAALASSILGASSLRNASDSRAQKLSDVLQHLERRIHSMLHGYGEGAAPPAPAALTAWAVRSGGPEPAPPPSPVIEPSLEPAAAEAPPAAALPAELPPEPGAAVEADE